MDRDWMRQQLESFSNLCLAYERSTPPGEYLGDERLYDQLHRAEPTVKQILRTLDPQLAEKVDIDQMAGEATARHQAQRALGILADLDEWKVRLAPDAPSLVADRFHPWIWDAARTFWDSRHYRAAVHAAASSINAHTQTKLGRTDISDDKVIQEAFSDKPAEAGKPRLRVAGDPTSPTTQSRQRGALQLGLAAFFAIRNPAAHDTAEWTQHEALEQLAVLSVLARLIDTSSVQR
ncbi:TIGR02391 family protein [Actinacidiphila sp. DG2A-62]|uniref:TIGR02391 family protein n=1 Tax=Actinacidiphila sp. DG2A-62 TaxID=3108821 RepID=UPI002DBB85E3|nr:TIGR02391 family protein [Actinacidiphila sp. DG2A-62]MEC3996113.1 TIGR02391 family protein [Actinacidiphila sp. DG2A-62]